jgi:signal transduction histidine kinase
VSHSGEIELIFSDTCNTVPATKLKKAFKPFQDARSHAWNNELGMAVVHEIIQAKGGRISVDTQEGQGTTFRLFLPTAN